MAAQSYSFIDVNASITGPGGTFALGSGAAEEGITIDQADDKTSLIMGADGSGMHSLHAAANGIVTVTLLKTSPVNQLLMAMYNLQSATAALTGQNVITITDQERGDIVVAGWCAFRKLPPLAYAKDGNTQPWAFNSAQINYVLGSGAPSLT